MALSKDDLARLADLDLAGVTVSAEIDAKGSFHSVDEDGLAAKIRALDERNRDFGVSSILVVAAEQRDVLASRAGRILVLKAGDLREAIELLDRERGYLAAARRQAHAASSEIRLRLLAGSIPMEDWIPMSLVPPATKDDFVAQHALSERETEGSQDTIAELDRTLHRVPVRSDPVSLEELLGSLANQARIVILGPSGAGKTTLLKYLAWISSFPRGVAPQNERHRGLRERLAHLVPVSVRVLEWQAWTRKTSEPSLAKYLAEQSSVGPGPHPKVQHWNEWLEHGRAILLLDELDGLSDLNPSFHEHLGQTLDACRDCLTIVTCRTSCGIHRSLPPTFHVHVLDEFDQKARDQYLTSFQGARPPGGPDQEAMARSFRRHVRGSPWAGNPQWISILCHVLDWKSAPVEEHSRSALYRAALLKIVDEFENLELLAAVSLRIALEHGTTPLIPGELFRDIPKRVLDLVVEKGLLVRREADYHFLHPTFQEYLAARGLADLAKRDSSTIQIIDQMAADPAWHEVLLFAAGEFESPLEFLELLAARDEDDDFGWRLALAARCLAEILPAKRPPNLASRIASRALELWWTHAWRDTTDAVGHLVPALRALAWAGLEVEASFLSDEMLRGRMPASGRADLFRLVDSLGRFGEDEANELDRWRVRAAVCRTLEAFGEAAVGRRADLSRTLAKYKTALLDDVWLYEATSEDGGARKHSSLARLIADDELLAEIVERLESDDGTRWPVALCALHWLGPAAATPRLTEWVARLLSSPPQALLDGMARGPCSLGDTDPSALLALTSRLRTLRDLTPLFASSIFRATGQETVGAEILRTIERAFTQLENFDDLQTWMELVCAIGEKACTRRLVESLERLLRHWVGDLPVEIFARTIGALGRCAMTPRTTTWLLECLEDSRFHPAVASALHRLGDGAVRARVIERLARALESDRKISVMAAFAIRDLGLLNDPSFKKGLAGLLDQDGPLYAVMILKSLTDRKFLAEILIPRLDKLLDPRFEALAVNAAALAARAGLADLFARVPQLIRDLLRSPSEFDRLKALPAIAEGGLNMLTADDFEILMGLLKHGIEKSPWTPMAPDAKLRRAAARTLAGFMADGFRFRVENGRWEVWRLEPAPAKAQ